MRPVALSSIVLTLLCTMCACRSNSSTAPASGTKDTMPATAPQPEPAAAVRPAAEGLGSSAADAPDSTLAKDTRPLIVCFGDSLTAGFGTDPGESYPDFLQRDLDRAGAKYRVVNLGISGNTTKDGVERVARVAALHPSIVVVEFGGNDGLRGLRIADTQANLDRILATLATGKTAVALAGITLPPDYGPEYIAKFDAMYTELAHRYRVPLLPFLLKGVFGTPGMMQPDRTHATAAGNEVVARNVMELIRPLLRR